jgi:hypothetical protein
VVAQQIKQQGFLVGGVKIKRTRLHADLGRDLAHRHRCKTVTREEASVPQHGMRGPVISECEPLRRAMRQGYMNARSIERAPSLARRSGLRRGQHRFRVRLEPRDRTDMRFHCLPDLSLCLVRCCRHAHSFRRLTARFHSGGGDCTLSVSLAVRDIVWRAHRQTPVVDPAAALLAQGAALKAASQQLQATP